MPADQTISTLLPSESGSSQLEWRVDISVSDIRVAADIGVYAHEKGRPQALVIDVVIGVHPPRADRLAATIDYNIVVAHAVQLAAQRIELIETFAERLAMLCLRHEGVNSVRVEVRKPGALVNGLAAAHVFLRRARRDDRL